MVKEKNTEYYKGLNKILFSFQETFKINEGRRIFNLNEHFLHNTKILGRKKQVELIYFEILRLNNQFN